MTRCRPLQAPGDPALGSSHPAQQQADRRSVDDAKGRRDTTSSTTNHNKPTNQQHTQPFIHVTSSLSGSSAYFISGICTGFGTASGKHILQRAQVAIHPSVKRTMTSSTPPIPQTGREKSNRHSNFIHPTGPGRTTRATKKSAVRYRSRLR